MEAVLDSNQSVNPQKRRSSSFSIDTALSFANYPVVTLCAKMLGFREYPSGRDDNQPCDIYWCNVAHLDFSTVVKSSGSRVNKLPGMSELSKKVSLTHAISSMEKLFPQAYMFYPRSFFLPVHYEDLKTYWKETLLRYKEQGRDEEPYFIVKPNEDFIDGAEEVCLGAQGTGIYLINDLSQIKDPTMEQLVQEQGRDEEPYFIVKPNEDFIDGAEEVCLGAQGTGIYLINDLSQIKDPTMEQLVQQCDYTNVRLCYIDDTTGLRTISAQDLFVE
ncbi:unnamed protein product [Angiostrongylus costaricensis]|uniref:ATP-grasp domain-containing protein n=1 Tax=Angiostrongylus costaricensis TaxID=334426 RepID=A0A0R3Q1C2_ANGCS|nr:unnamed protein product [Angiostrongylus costaricensis]